MLAFALIKSRYIDVKRVHYSSFSENLEQLNTSSHEKTNTYFKMLRELLEIKVWLCLSLGISILYFIVTGIQFWISNYMETVLHQPAHLVYIVFSCVSITAPVLGCIIGINNIHKCLYEVDRLQATSEDMNLIRHCTYAWLFAL